MSQNPFATTAPAAEPVQHVTPAAPQAAPVSPAAPQAAPAAPQAAPVSPAAAVVGDMATDSKKPRKKPNRQMTLEERKFVIENYSTRSTSDMARELGLTRQQVYRTVHEARGKIKERIESATQSNNTELANKLQSYMQERLPEKPFGGGAGGASKGSSVDTVLDDLLAGV